MKKNIDIVLNDFLVQQNLHEELCAKYDPETDSYYEESGLEDLNDLVVLGGYTNKRADKLFMEYCGELGLKVPVSVETLSFLHEIGHHNTLPFLNKTETFLSKIVKIKLCGTKRETDSCYLEYFKCPEEREATLDAIFFCNENPEVAMKLSKDIEEALYGTNDN